MRTVLYTGASPSQITKRGEEIYQKQLKETLELKHHGKYVAIEPESGDYFIGDDPVEADTKAQEKHPDKVFYLKRIGYESAFSSPQSAPSISTIKPRIT